MNKIKKKQDSQRTNKWLPAGRGMRGQCKGSTLRSLLFFAALGLRLEKALAPHSSNLAWKIPWMEEPGRLQSMGSLRVRHGWATSLSPFTFMHWRRKWQPTPVLLPGKSQGRGSLVGCHLWSRTESDTLKRLSRSSSRASLQPWGFSLAAPPVGFSLQCWPSPVMEHERQSPWAQQELL